MGNNYFIFGIHNHQPLGNSEDVLKEAYEKSYLPFIEVMEKYPEISFHLHISGPLLLWLKDNKPEYILKIKKLIKRGQMEILGGGFYEPILTMLSEKDRIGQISSYKKYLEDLFEIEISGIWTAERVWEPDLPTSLEKAGISYTLLDDYHFKGVGIYGKNLYGYYLVEYRTSFVKVFPISEKLRYSIPFSPVKETVDWIIDELDLNGGGVIVFMDDGEKFGLWPETYETVYKKKWLENFCSYLLEKQNKKNLITAKLSNYIKEQLPDGRVYLQCSSYSEMDEWSLPIEARLEHEKIRKKLEGEKKTSTCINFFRGGYWKNMLVFYPEANQMQKRIMMLSSELDEIEEKKNIEKAKDFIFRAQCNCPFWHGTFGGVYLIDIRQENYSNFIRALKERDKLVYGGKSFFEVYEKDVDCDGEKELVVSNNYWSFLIRPKHGASFSEVSSKFKEINISNVATRRKEAYHKDMEIVQDWYRRYSFLDHFFHPDTKLEEYVKNSYGEQGDFVNQEYVFEVDDKKNLLKVIFKRDGGVWGEKGERFNIEVKKELVIYKDKDIFSIFYNIKNSSQKDVQLFFAPELNLSLLSCRPGSYFEVNKHKFGFDEIKEIKEVKSVFMIDELKNVGVNFSLSENVTLWHFPVEQFSNSERGIEKTYQGSSLTFLLSFELKEGADKKFSLNIKMV